MTKKENSRISVNKIDKLLASQTKKTVTIPFLISDTETIEVAVKPVLSFLEMVQFVTEITESVFIENDEFEIEYLPYYKDITMVRSILAHYSDLKYDIAPEKLYCLGYSESFLKIRAVICEEQFSQMLSSIHKGIEYKKQMLLSAEKQALNQNLKEMERCLDSLEKMFQEFSKIDMSKLPEIYEKISETDEYSLAKAVLEVKFANETGTEQIDG